MWHFKARRKTPPKTEGSLQRTVEKITNASIGAFQHCICYQGLLVLMFPTSKSGFTPSKFDGGTEKPLFLEPQSLMDSSKKKKFSLPDTFSSRSHFLWRRKWVNVIPFLMVEQANLLTSPIVDWLSDGREAGDKRKVQKERFIWLSPLPHSPSLGRQTIAAAGLSWRLLFSILPRRSAALCLCLRPGPALNSRSQNFLCL